MLPAKAMVFIPQRMEALHGTLIHRVPGTMEQRVVFAFEPGNTNVIYAGFLSLGVCRSEDASNSWELKNKGIATLLTNDIEVNPSNPLQILVGFEAENSGGCYISNDGGESWQMTNGLPGTRFSQVAIGFNGFMYAWSNGPSSIAQEGLYKSVDGGSTWTNMGPNIGGLFETEIFGLAVSEINPDLIFIGGNNFGVNGWESVVYRSINGGTDWENVFIGPEFNSFRYVFIDPNSDDEIIYAGYASQSDHAGIIKSIDGGSTWIYINNGIPAMNKWSGAVITEPDNPEIVYCAVGGSGELNATVFKSFNGGNAWASTNLNLGSSSKVTDLLISPLDNQIVYAATAENGVYMTLDGGLNWQATEPEIPAGFVTHFSRPFFTNDTAYLCASTYSSSAYRTKIFDPISSIEKESENEASLYVQNNPSFGNCIILFELKKFSFVSLEVFNLNGQFVEKPIKGSFPSGNYKFEIKLQPGMYYLIMKTENSVESGKIVIL